MSKILTVPIVTMPNDFMLALVGGDAMFWRQKRYSPFQEHIIKVSKVPLLDCWDTSTWPTTHVVLTLNFLL